MLSSTSGCRTTWEGGAAAAGPPTGVDAVTVTASMAGGCSWLPHSLWCLRDEWTLFLRTRLFVACADWLAVHPPAQGEAEGPHHYHTAQPRWPRCACISSSSWQRRSSPASGMDQPSPLVGGWRVSCGCSGWPSLGRGGRISSQALKRKCKRPCVRTHTDTQCPPARPQASIHPWRCAFAPLPTPPPGGHPPPGPTTRYADLVARRDEGTRVCNNSPGHSLPTSCTRSCGPPRMRTNWCGRKPTRNSRPPPTPNNRPCSCAPSPWAPNPSSSPQPLTSRPRASGRACPRAACARPRGSRQQVCGAASSDQACVLMTFGPKALGL